MPRLALSFAFFPSLSTIMSSSSSNLATAPLIVFGDQPEGTQVPIVPNRELKQGAFCIVNPDFWGAGDRRVFNGTIVTNVLQRSLDMLEGPRVERSSLAGSYQLPVCCLCARV